MAHKGDIERDLDELAQSHAALSSNVNGHMRGAISNLTKDIDRIDAKLREVDHNVADVMKEQGSLEADVRVLNTARLRDVSDLADEINQLAMIVEEMFATNDDLWTVQTRIEMRARMRRVRDSVAHLIIDEPAENGLKEYTILHHVRVRTFDEALKLADNLSGLGEVTNVDAEIIQTKVTAGMKELS